MSRVAAFTASLALAALAGCGQPAAGHPAATGGLISSPTPATSSRIATAATPPRVATPARDSLPTPPPTLRFAVLEAKGAGSFLGAGQGDRPDTVAIVGLDGVAVAKTTFPPRATVFVGNAAPIQGPVARTAAGAVFYADGTGTLRRLDGNGQVSTVATFPLIDPQQQLRFAVSPDGSEAMGSVVSFPPKRNPPPQDLSQPLFQDGAHWRLDTYYAKTGGTASKVASTDLGDQYPRQVSVIAGWDAVGPMVGQAELGSQQPPESLLGATAIQHADRSAAATGPILGGGDCREQSFAGTGEVLCLTGVPVTAQIRTAAGVPEWNVAGDCLYPNSGIQVMTAISPKGLRVASSRNICSRDGTVFPVPAGFHPQGWLDDNTLIGTVGDFNGNLSLVRLSDPAVVDDLGFRGQFVGVVSPA